MKHFGTAKFRTAIITLLFSASSGAQAQSAPDATYEYDELGRLVKVTYSNEMDQGFYYDPAGNREAVVIAAEGELPAEAPESGRIVVVPIAGFTIIPL